MSSFHLPSGGAAVLAPIAMLWGSPGSAREKRGKSHVASSPDTVHLHFYALESFVLLPVSYNFELVGVIQRNRANRSYIFIMRRWLTVPGGREVPRFCHLQGEHPGGLVVGFSPGLKP